MDSAKEAPSLLVMLGVGGEREHSPTARAARETGLTTDGVTCHLRRLSARWGAGDRTELVARAYALGVLTTGVRPPAVPSG